MFRYIVLLAVCMLALIVLGALVTSELQPIPGADAPAISTSSPTEAWLERIHANAATAVGVLALGLAVWLQLAEKRAWLRWLGWIVVAGVVIESWMGMRGEHQSLPPSAAFFHAALAPVLLAIAVAAGAGIFGRHQGDNLKEDSGRPSFRLLAMVVLLLALLQVLLGAAYRHGLMGVLMHILNALIVTILVLVVCILLIRQYPDHRSLRLAAVVLGIVTGVQVALGFATFITLVIGSKSMTTLLILSVTHVAIGALALAASVLMAMQTWQNLRSPI